MKTKIALSLMFLWLAGCQPKSEIDKCVDAIALSFCVSVPPTLGKENPTTNRSDCIKETTESFGAKFRLQCLRAQAGKE
jgi:hypothetical protein